MNQFVKQLARFSISKLKRGQHWDNFFPTQILKVRTHLLGTYPDKFSARSNLHDYFLESAAALAWSLAILPPWPLNLRVKENSPNRWPTILSVTNTGI